jgi:dTDP-4-dehydrorhamnose reductase
MAGRVDRYHPLYGYLLRSGASERELGRFREQPCLPSIMGFNYYVTGERFLDSRVALYPSRCLGGNGRHRYADVEAVRVCKSGLVGPAALLSEAYQRYRTPLALTEAHLAGHPDEQARWFSYLWHAAESARARGADVRAVTAWALCGSYGWDQLVTRGPSSYEAGAFRVEGERLLETPYAGFLRAVAQGTPQVAHGGWWHSDERLLYEESDAHEWSDASVRQAIDE